MGRFLTRGLGGAYREIFGVFGRARGVAPVRPTGSRGPTLFLVRDEASGGPGPEPARDRYIRTPMVGYPAFGIHSLLGAGTGGEWLGYRSLFEEYFVEGYRAGPAPDRRDRAGADRHLAGARRDRPAGRDLPHRGRDPRSPLLPDELRLLRRHGRDRFRPVDRPRPRPADRPHRPRPRRRRPHAARAPDGGRTRRHGAGLGRPDAARCPSRPVR